MKKSQVFKTDISTELKIKLHENIDSVEFRIKGYGTNIEATYANDAQVEFEITQNGETSHKVFSKYFLAKILANSFKVEEFIESSLNNPINELTA